MTRRDRDVLRGWTDAMRGVPADLRNESDDYREGYECQLDIQARHARARIQRNVRIRRQ